MKECKFYILHFLSHCKAMCQIISRISCLKKHGILFFLCIYLNQTYSQQNLLLPPNQLKEKGKIALNMKDYFSAVDFLQKYVSIKPSDIDGVYLLAQSYHYSKNYDLAKEYYLKVYQKDPKKYPNSLYYYSLMLKYIGYYDAAIEHFNRFMEETESEKNALLSQAIIEIEGCEMAKISISEDVDFSSTITPLNNSINHAYIDFSPFLINSDTLLYATYLEDSVKYYPTIDSTKRRVFFKAYKYANNWEGEKSIIEPFNDTNFHVGNGAYSLDRKRFYFTKCNSVLECKLYFSKLDSIWTTPLELPNNINIPEYTNTQPAVQTLNETTDIIYYISDRNDGIGGTDIWFTEYNHVLNKATEPINLGKKVNTPYDEVTPFYHHASNSLYFSSNGYASFGGLDIFKTKGQKLDWKPIENIGFPFNSSYDDQYYVLDEKDETKGFFTSNRDGTTPLKNKNCCDDIFSFIKTEEPNIAYEGKLYNASYIERILDMDDDEQKNNIIQNELNYIIPNQKVVMYTFSADHQLIPIDSTITDSNGEFTFAIKKNKKYKFIIERDGFFNKHHEFNTKKVENGTIKEHIGMVEITLEPIIIKNIYYPFDEWYLTKEAKITIDTTVYKIMIENPKLIIELSSHTDNFGTDEYNDKLSQRRAESVVNYMISKNIEKNRLQPKGYGERRPIAPNSYSDGTDNPIGRQKNRRTEFRVIGKIVNGKEIIYEE